MDEAAELGYWTPHMQKLYPGIILEEESHRS
jgi:hypothetical protein